MDAIEVIRLRFVGLSSGADFPWNLGSNLLLEVRLMEKQEVELMCCSALPEKLFVEASFLFSS